MLGLYKVKYLNRNYAIQLSPEIGIFITKTRSNYLFLDARDKSIFKELLV